MSRTSSALLLIMSTCLIDAGCASDVTVLKTTDAAVHRPTDAASSCGVLSCSGHGRCLVDDAGTATCDCDPGFVAGSPLLCLRADLPAGSCRSTLECPAEQVCSVDLHDFGCTDPVCGLPVQGAGDLALGASCARSSDCGHGLTCVWHEWRIPDGMQGYEPHVGICLPVCDPCQPDCPPSTECLQIASGGGFCYGPLLAVRGEGCRGVVCAGGLSCHATRTPSPSIDLPVDVPICLRPCAPGSTPGVPGRHSASQSPDCSSSETCVPSVSAATTAVHGCQIGELVATGHPCGNHRFCRGPDVCTYGICTPIDCTGGCPDGTECYNLVSTSGICIADGVLPLGQDCVDTRTCVVGLVCAPTGTIPTQKSCQAEKE